MDVRSTWQAGSAVLRQAVGLLTEWAAVHQVAEAAAYLSFGESSFVLDPDERRQWGERAQRLWPESIRPVSFAGHYLLHLVATADM